MTNIQNSYHDTRIDQLETPSDVFNYLLSERIRYQKAYIDLLPKKVKQQIYHTLCAEDEALRQIIDQ